MEDQPGTLLDEQAPTYPVRGQGIGEENRDERGIYRIPGFDMQATLQTLNAPIVEIGGPTVKPFELLEDVTLPSQPIVMNIAGSNFREQGSASLTPEDIGKLDAVADVSHLPVSDESLGMVIASNLPTLQVSRIRELMQGTTPENQQDKYRHGLSVVAQEYEKATASILAGRRDEAEASASPRIATISQAARVLRPGGLLLIRGIDPADAQIARMLGFEASAHNTATQEPTVLGDMTQPMPSEVVFQKLISADTTL